MAGYSNWSMSNNAVKAYAEGKKPLSKWSKKAIIQAATDSGFSEKHVEQLRETALTNLRKYCLDYTEWHHTSKMYKITNFYELKDEEAIFFPNRKLALKELTELQEEFDCDEGILKYEIKNYSDWKYRSIISTSKVMESWGEIDHHHMTIYYLSDDQVKDFIGKHNKKIAEKTKDNK